jgi:integrase
VFTDAEIAALMEAAAHLRYALTAETYRTLLGLLATTGIRPGEAFGLDRDRAGLEAGVLTVVSTKTSQIRKLGLHHTSIAALAGYARRRDLLCPHPAQPYFLLSVRGTRLNATIADRTFRSLARAAGVTAARTAPGRCCAHSGTPSRSPPSSAGTATASTSTRPCPRYPRGWATAIRATPTGTSRPLPSCSPWPWRR